MLVLLFLALSLALCQSEPLGKLVDDRSPESKSEEVDLDQVGDSALWSERKEGPLKPISQLKCNNIGTECQKLGGWCYPSNLNLNCDYTKADGKICPSKQCQCCISCAKAWENSHCQKAGGLCKKACECRPYEYTDVFNPCKATGCTCCRKCDQSRDCTPGICAADTKHYLNQNNGYYVDRSKRCNQPECSCIQKCKGKRCTSVGGYCIRDKEECKNGYKLIQHCGCDSESCGCCIPEARTHEAAQALQCSIKSDNEA